MFTHVATPKRCANHNQTKSQISELEKQFLILTPKLEELDHERSKPQHLGLGNHRTIDLASHSMVKRFFLGTVLLHHPMIQKDVECGHPVKTIHWLVNLDKQVMSLFQNNKFQFLGRFPPNYIGYYDFYFWVYKKFIC